eukprot:UN01689
MCYNILLLEQPLGCFIHAVLDFLKKFFKHCEATVWHSYWNWLRFGQILIEVECLLHFLNQTYIPLKLRLFCSACRAIINLTCATLPRFRTAPEMLHI